MTASGGTTPSAAPEALARADEAQDIAEIRVGLGARSYSVHAGEGVAARTGALLMPHLKRQRVFVLADDAVEALHGDALREALDAARIASEWKSVAPGEASKSWDGLGEVLGWLLERGAERSDVLLAFGGGVTGDLAGLAAALLKRGMGLVQLPTTLLAQVDSSVGGKTAVNHPLGKNLIGAFHQPRLVLADTGWLRTLPVREWRAGLAEVLKYALIGDPMFFNWIEANTAPLLARDPAAVRRAVARSVEAKAAIVAQDERESGVRQLLNLGHTFGHALEAEAGYDGRLLHGEAVGAGMALAFRYSERLGVAPAGEAARAERALSALGLETRPARLGGAPFDAARLTTHMRSDKKARAGQVPLILARRVGAAFVKPGTDLADVEAFWAEQLTE